MFGQGNASRGITLFKITLLFLRHTYEIDGFSDEQLAENGKGNEDSKLHFF